MDEETYFAIFGTKKWRHKRWITSEEYLKNKDSYDRCSKDFEYIVDGVSLDRCPPEKLSLLLPSNDNSNDDKNSLNQNDKFNFNYKIYGPED